MPIGKTITDPAAWSLDVESRMPAAQMIRLQMEQAGTRNDKKNDPRDSPRHPQTRVKQFRYAEAEKSRCQKICGGADQLIADSRDNCTERPDEILRGMICRRSFCAVNCASWGQERTAPTPSTCECRHGTVFRFPGISLSKKRRRFLSCTLLFGECWWPTRASNPASMC